MRRPRPLAPIARLLLAVCVAAGFGAPHAAAAGGGMVICGASGAYTVPFGPEAPAVDHDAAHCALLCAAAAPPTPAGLVAPAPVAAPVAPVVASQAAPLAFPVRLPARGPPAAV